MKYDYRHRGGGSDTVPFKEREIEMLARKVDRAVEKIREHAMTADKIDVESVDAMYREMKPTNDMLEVGITTSGVYVKVTIKHGGKRFVAHGDTRYENKRVEMKPEMSVVLYIYKDKPEGRAPLDDDAPDSPERRVFSYFFVTYGIENAATGAPIGMCDGAWRFDDDLDTIVAELYATTMKMVDFAQLDRKKQRVSLPRI